RNRVPVASDRAGSLADAEGIATREAANTVEVGRLESRPPVTQVVCNSESVDSARDLRVPRERLGRRREKEIAGTIGVEARMHAVGIAGAEQVVLAAVPDYQREEALDSFKQPVSPTQICIEDERRVGCCREGELVEPLPAGVEKPVEQHCASAVVRDAVR